MRLFNALTITITIFSLSNAIPTTPSLALTPYNHNRQPRTAQESRTDIHPLIPPSLSPRDLSTPTRILANSLRILNNNLTIALPSPNSISAIAILYTQISSTVLKNIAGAPKHYFTFTLGAYRMVISCPTEAIPWALIGDIVNDVREWMGGRWAPVEASFRFLGANPYLVEAPAVIFVSVGLVGALGRELGGG